MKTRKPIDYLVAGDRVRIKRNETMKAWGVALAVRGSGLGAGRLAQVVSTRPRGDLQVCILRLDAGGGFEANSAHLERITGPSKRGRAKGGRRSIRDPKSEIRNRL
jgi:hypothetical protein